VVDKDLHEFEALANQVRSQERKLENEVLKFQERINSIGVPGALEYNISESEKIIWSFFDSCFVFNGPATKCFLVDAQPAEKIKAIRHFPEIIKIVSERYLTRLKAGRKEHDNKCTTSELAPTISKQQRKNSKHASDAVQKPVRSSASKAPASRKATKSGSKRTKKNAKANGMRST
jgi:hypothetical protein